MYLNPVKAPVREIIHNHLDEHKCLRLDRPVEITMPTIFEPTWRSRDFGESLDHEFMMDGFMTLGESRKEGDHSQAGYWGVGSKSPLAYTDQFTVRCIQNRRFRLYLVKFKTLDYPDGSYDTRPVITYIEEGITAEPDGTEVSWAIALKDVGRFERSVTEILAGMFDCTLPTVIANGSPTDRFNPTAKVLQQGQDWRLLEAGVTVTRAHVRVSNILYPLDGYALPGIKDAVRNILEVPLIIDFGTADLHIQPSRDGLEYSDKTVTAVEAKLTAICDELVSELQAEISACPSRWDAIRLFQDRLRGQTKVMATLYTTAIRYEDRPLPKGQVGIPKWLTEEEHRAQVRFTTVEAIRPACCHGP